MAADGRPRSVERTQGNTISHLSLSTPARQRNRIEAGGGFAERLVPCWCAWRGCLPSCRAVWLFAIGLLSEYGQDAGLVAAPRLCKVGHEAAVRTLFFLCSSSLAVAHTALTIATNVSNQCLPRPRASRAETLRLFTSSALFPRVVTFSVSSSHGYAQNVIAPGSEHEYLFHDFQEQVIRVGKNTRVLFPEA